MKKIWIILLSVTALALSCNKPEEPKPDPTVNVESVTLNKTELALVEGDEFTLTATVKPANATNKTVTWSSSNTAVATVDGGKVKAVKDGSTTISAKAGTKTATCVVTVSKKVIAVTEVKLDKAEVSLVEGEETTLTATVKPDNATDKTVTWTSDNTAVATVEGGKVKAVKEGTASITAKAGDKSATCTVTVSKKEIAVTEVTLDKAEVSLVEGEETTLTATVKPDDATDKTVTWSSNNTAVATVEGGKVKAVKEGAATITAKAGDKSATCSVTVTKKVIAVTKVTLNKSEVSLVEGEETTLTATVKPDNATDKTVTWTSSNASVATVEGGKVKAVKEGTATITAKAGDKSATCSVTVTKKVIPVTGVSLNKSTLSLNKGQSETLTATVSPSDATDKTVTWTSSNTAVATVDGGKVTAVKTGTATITAKAGGKTATCRVTVKTPVESITLDLNSVTLEEGKTTTLTATVNPADADDKTVTWSSDNTAVATVTSGKVKAVKEGTATITAKAGDKTATCVVTVSKKVVAVTSVTLDKTSLTLTEGEDATLTATVKPTNATDKTVTWSSSDASIATVDQNGKVVAVKEGKATITAKAGEKSATCSLTVNKKVVPVASVTLNQTFLALEEGGGATLTATVSPDDATDKTVTWSSSDTSVATVDQNGAVKAVKAGSSIITAKAGNKSATCTVVVNSPSVPATAVSLNKPSLSLYEGTSETLTATVTPSNSTDHVSWSTSDASVATVANGKVTAVAEGTATITAKAGEKEATCVVTVIKAIPVSSVTLDQTTLALNKGASATLTATVSPDNATDKTVTWSSNKTSVATVDQNGKVTAVGGGEATITAKAGNISATCTVTVTAPVTSVSLNRTSLTLQVGATATLTATVYPSDATDKTVTWESSKPAFATVDQNGKVTAVAGGETTITATAGGKTATCTVTVTVPVSSVTLDQTALALVKGGFATLTATVLPDEATDKTVTWSSNKTSVATVDQNGKVTAVGGGEATITATSGGKSATCKVTVTVPVTSVSLNKANLTLKVGASETLVATVNPSDATNKTVNWESTKPEFATVDQNGKVTAVAVGETTIKVTIEGKEATCKVVVSAESDNTEDYGQGNGEWED